ncbi:MAG TPA: cytochrome c biogenesis protein ResB [Planctomycetota bacterium]|nr:cytochrome c biogenesis protein ResB [Planctomycetota bacterium]HRR82586.1 cytochrome c biogenesis protein ResB [Planctomycetota bacterium]HRT95052.1 cytochrome c biogenesis protein ResB [Planctomycetota bacterium]
MAERHAISNSRSPIQTLWRAVAGVRLAVALLALIAVASTVGVVLPQPESFNPASYLERRLAPHSSTALRPAEFVALARAAGVLAGDETFESLARRVQEGPLAEADWDGVARALGPRLQQGDARDSPCLRLSYVDSFGPVLGRAMLLLRIHTLFTSLWFRALCAALLVNLVACSAERLPAQWRMAFRHRPSEDPAWYRRRAVHAEAVAEPGVAAALEASLRSGGFRVRRLAAGRCTMIEGARGWLGALGRWWAPLGQLAGVGRLGAQVVHAGVVLIVVGGFISSQLSFRHVQLLARGEVVAVPLDPRAASQRDWRERPGEAPGAARFRLQLRRFEFRADALGKPEYFGSHVTLLDTTPPTDTVIEVNHPLVYRGFHVYQQSYQPDYRGVTSVSFLVARMRRAPQEGGAGPGDPPPPEVLEQVSLSVPPGMRVSVPGTDLALRVVNYFPHWQIPLEQTPDGRIVAGEARNASDDPVNPAVRIALEAPGEEPRQRWVPLPLRSGEPRPGGMVDFGDYRILPVDFAPEYATWLTFKTHPAMLPVWAGCAVMMVGVVLCFYCTHERVWALVRPRGDGREEVFLAGDSFKWRERFRQRFAALAAGVGSPDSATTEDAERTP